jgi:uncharacterized protein
MRRSEKEITDRRRIDQIIMEAVVCRVAMSIEDRPYLVPLSFGYDGEALYFHSSAVGRKINILKQNNRVCFEFDLGSQISKAERACSWGVDYQSVIGEGRAIFIENFSEKEAALGWIMKHYGSEDHNFSKKAVEKTCIFKIKIEQMSGKAAGYALELDPPEPILREEN